MKIFLTSFSPSSLPFSVCVDERASFCTCGSFVRVKCYGFVGCCSNASLLLPTPLGLVTTVRYPLPLLPLLSLCSTAALCRMGRQDDTAVQWIPTECWLNCSFCLGFLCLLLLLVYHISFWNYSCLIPGGVLPLSTTVHRLVCTLGMEPFFLLWLRSYCYSEHFTTYTTFKRSVALKRFGWRWFLLTQCCVVVL